MGAVSAANGSLTAPPSATGCRVVRSGFGVSGAAVLLPDSPPLFSLARAAFRFHDGHFVVASALIGLSNGGYRVRPARPGLT